MSCVAALAALALGCGPGAVRADAAATSAGEVLLVDPTSNAPILTGSSQAPFALRPPAMASCSGSSRKDGYFVTGFVTSAANGPADLAFDADGPHATSGIAYHLIDASHSPYVQRNTDLPLPGSPEGRVQPSGALTWTDFDTTTLPPGDYQLGLACTRSSDGVTTLDRYWDARISVVVDSADPLRFTWKLAGVAGVGGAQTASSSHAGRNVAMAVAAIVLVGLAGGTARRRRARLATQSSERVRA